MKSMQKKRSIALALFLGLMPGATGGLTHAQSCNPAVVSLIVRDERGNVLSEAELKSISEQLPDSIDDARVNIGEVSFAEDGKTFY